MPRNPHPGVSTHRNRNRINNKTRLKIHHGNLDSDALLIPDEDEEKHRLTNLVAGVDAEDANEHHLQVVLSASQRSSIPTGRSGRNEKPSQAFIPTPDSNGIVDDYEENYLPNRWKDPLTYLCTSTVMEEACLYALANGFTYYMDERDKDWLDKNNEEARGEGTSAQGSVSTSGTRVSARSAKAKGKEPDVSQPLVITEDEFELLMGLFEKVTHEKTEFLHHSLQTGMAFPAFAEYQDTFTAPLPVSTFANFTVPSWIPQPPALLRLAKAIYPHWRERRIERGGHRIIPTLNYDEADVPNESYICFRRREIKAVRKTRASQVTSSDKLARLQAELFHPLELAKAILQRETLKKEQLQQAHAVWEKRMGLAEFRRKYPSLGEKGDEELLVDKERIVKKSEPTRIPLKIRQEVSTPMPRPEVSIRPKDRLIMIADKVEQTLQQQKHDDHQWEDAIDNPYQAPPSSYASRLFKFIPLPSPPSSPAEDSDEDQPAPRAIRVRIGRGGRRLVDRRLGKAPAVLGYARRQRPVDSDEDMEGIPSEDDEEDRRRLEAQWRFDTDDGPAIGPQGSEEQCRMLVDDYDAKYLRHHMTLLGEADHQSVITDPSLLVMLPDGRQQLSIPYRLGGPPVIRRELQRAYAPGPTNMPPPSGILPISASGNTSISAQQQLKKVPPPGTVPQMRISSNGGMRPPSLPPTPSLQTNGSVLATSIHSSPPQPIVVPQASPVNGTTPSSRPAITMPHIDNMKIDPPTISALHPNSISAIQVVQPKESPPIAQPQPQVPTSQIQPQQPSQSPILQPVQQQQRQQQQDTVVPSAASPPKPKMQVPIQNGATNGYHLSLNGFPANPGVPNSVAYQQAVANLNQQQMQTLKTAIANLPPGQDIAALQARGNFPNSFMLPGNGGFNLQLAANTGLKMGPNRWSMGANLQRPNSVVNSVEGVQMNGAMSPQANHAHVVPVRSPSTNGTRPTIRTPNGHAMIATNGQMPQHVMSPRLQHASPSPMPAIIQSQSPPRVPMTPSMNIPSPSLQQQQPVGTPQSGY